MIADAYEGGRGVSTFVVLYVCCKHSLVHYYTMIMYCR
jgi:hypothetical protein